MSAADRAFELAGLDPAALTGARERAEAAEDDVLLLALRELELAWRELPGVVDGARRTRLLDADPVATTWEGWDTALGQRLLLRCLRPRWLKDPVILRRFTGPVRALRPPTPSVLVPVARLDGDWPHLRLALPGPLLNDLLPGEGPADTLLVARLLAHGLSALAALHAAGRTHGGDLSRYLVADPDQPRLAWLDRFGPQGDVAGDLRSLAAAVAALDPDGDDPVAQVATAWAQQPPPTARDAQRLLDRTLSQLLLAERHRLARHARRSGRRDATFRLAGLVARLQGVLPPPAGRFCLRAGHDAVLVLVDARADRVVGGPAAGATAAHLPRAWSRAQGLDPTTARFLLRSWATRGTGDEARREAVQRELQATDEGAQALVRWLSAMARLRASERLLRLEGRVLRGQLKETDSR